MRRALALVMAVALGCSDPTVSTLQVDPASETPSTPASLAALGWELWQVELRAGASHSYSPPGRDDVVITGQRYEFAVARRVGPGSASTLDPALRLLFPEEVRQFNVAGQLTGIARDAFDDRPSRARPRMGRSLVLMIDADTTNPRRVRAAFSVEGGLLQEPLLGAATGTMASTVLDQYATLAPPGDAGTLTD